MQNTSMNKCGDKNGIVANMTTALRQKVIFLLSPKYQHFVPKTISNEYVWIQMMERNIYSNQQLVTIIGGGTCNWCLDETFSVSQYTTFNMLFRFLFSSFQTIRAAIIWTTITTFVTISLASFFHLCWLHMRKITLKYPRVCLFETERKSEWVWLRLLHSKIANEFVAFSCRNLRFFTKSIESICVCILQRRYTSTIVYGFVYIFFILGWNTTFMRAFLISYQHTTCASKCEMIKCHYIVVESERKKERKSIASNE